MEFKPNLGINFSKVKNVYDLKDRAMLCDNVQFVLKHMNMEQFIAFRAGKLSLA